MAFSYKPPPVVVPTLDFKGSYHTLAKQMWLRDAAPGGSGRSLAGGFEDEEDASLDMPAAVNDAIGNEDRPHWDEVRAARGSGPRGAACWACGVLGAGAEEAGACEGPAGDAGADRHGAVRPPRRS